MQAVGAMVLLDLNRFMICVIVINANAADAVNELEAVLFKLSK